MNKDKEILHVGIDVGSTTTKIVVMDPETRNILYSDYRRHHADQVKSVADALLKMQDSFPGAKIRLVLTGSGAKPLSEALDACYIQEVVANSVALCEKYDEVGTAIELGGQDAKIIFFRKNENTEQPEVYDMRMNGSCAGGTGAFIDEIASVLNIPIEKFNKMADQGDCVYDVSGRCGVYAKTDIQPLLNQGVSKENLALSAFHAIAKQTIGGLAQGLEIKSPVVFEGGPLTFNPVLIRVFAQRLGLAKKDVLIPEHPELMMAYGAALSLERSEDEKALPERPEYLAECLMSAAKEIKRTGEKAEPFFSSDEERQEFERIHALPKWKPYQPSAGETVRAYLGIDSGSTTTKFVLMDEKEEILDSFYASNKGAPLDVAKEALLQMKKRYEDAGAVLEILGVGTTGYGEQLFANAFSAECHVVETVAHARAAAKYVPDASFILDIGGQDMKAIWLENGIITNIVVNEACSSGCGSFLENFASSLGIPVEEIARTAFDSKSPAKLGSRCTVFMNSSIVTEQRNGKLPGDIMAGLCRSIIENVFTKVIRISNMESLGKTIVVQGGTFQNDAVLRALEQYTGRQVIRAPYPGVMGAIGAALLTKERMQDGERTFIGLDALEDFSYTQQADMPCPFCANHCKRTIIRFSNGSSWVTNNRCERGEILGDPKDESVRTKLREKTEEKTKTANLFELREKLLFQDYPCAAPVKDRGITIGLPRVLFFWDTMPFWTTFFKGLGFRVKLSHASTRKMYENGLSAVTSDTVCFPGKLVHGHLRDLAKQKVDRIFLPSISTIPPENTEKTSESMCAVVKGHPLIIQNSDNPQQRFGIPFDAPLFFWYTREDRTSQLIKYMEDTFQIPAEETRAAIRAADEAQGSFRRQMLEAGDKVLKEAEKRGTYAVVLAARPYQTDSLVNHDLPSLFTSLGISVLTADSLPEANQTNLSGSTLDIVNNYHARMLSSAILAARDPRLEYVQIVSFGCGHDAYLSDEIIRVMKEISGKTPLVLKLDESDVQGPLRIRVRSFVETLNMKRDMKKKQGEQLNVKELGEPYPVKFTDRDRKEKVVLVPNTSHAFSRVMSAAMKKQGLRAEPLEIGRETAIRLGKQYVHNDICFPAQVVIGEALAALKSGKYDADHTAIAMGKYIGDCRLTHYSALLRKALDDAGFPQVPILTNDDKDSHNLHPGYKMNLAASLRIAFALPMIDVLEELLRKIRPYETVKGSADEAFEHAMDLVIHGLEEHGIRGAAKGFSKAVRVMDQIDYDRSKPKPRVLIVGEYLLNFHPGANHDIEAYLEKNGFEIIEARMTDVIRKIYFNKNAQVKEYHVHKPVLEKLWYATANKAFDVAHALTDRIAKAHPLYERACRLPELVKESDAVIPHTFDAGEGVLIPGEILHHAEHGCRAFIILQPFGCLPNHVVGRGIVKRLKEMYPDAQILSLDYDPDVSFANLENRLQMLVMNVKKEDWKEDERVKEKDADYSATA